MILSKTRRTLGVFLVLTLGYVPLAQAINLENHTLRYSVEYGSQHAGELEIITERDHNSLKTTVISHLSTMAKMFLNGLTTETWFYIDGQQLRVEKGHNLAHDSASVKKSFLIDRQNNVVKYHDGELIALQPEDEFEATTFPMVLVNSEIPDIAGKIIREISPKRDRWYVYLAPEQQSLDLDGKIYDTWKVTRHQQNDPSRTVTFWLDRNNQLIPLKIVTTRKGKDTTMKLIHNQKIS